ncbi:hypothetical protein PoB_004643700 [Plakobranchus ocellatus]|uniref:Uncharacterized protein n=1 Tax=Plakobranchus ocellatus TaxID=259542 RepID=A0AAV4BKM5_9GAST|nr:hypothetical protein PoB_004643700 [Plakobranchus ocellatus]
MPVFSDEIKGNISCPNNSIPMIEFQNINWFRKKMTLTVTQFAKHAGERKYALTPSRLKARHIKWLPGNKPIRQPVSQLNPPRTTKFSVCARGLANSTVHNNDGGTPRGSTTVRAMATHNSIKQTKNEDAEDDSEENEEDKEEKKEDQGREDDEKDKKKEVDEEKEEEQEEGGREKGVVEGVLYSITRFKNQVSSRFVT